MKNANDNTDAEVIMSVKRYEDMISNGRKDYFDEDDLLDVADYYYHDMERDEDALQCLDYALQLHPDCTVAKLQKAEIYFYGKRREEAWNILKSIDNREDTDFLYYYGLFTLETGDVPTANAYYKRAYFAQKGDCLDLFCQILWDFIDHDALQQVKEWFCILPKSYEEDPRVLEIKADYYHKLAQYDKAIELEEKLLDMDPYNAAYWNALTKMYYLKGEMGKAAGSVAYALDINPKDPESLMLSAEISSAQGDYGRAHELYDKYIKVDDKNSLMYFNNAQALLMLCKFREAKDQLFYALKYCDDKLVNKHDIYNTLGRTCLALNDTGSSRLYFGKAFDEDKDESMFGFNMLSVALQEAKDDRIEYFVDKILEDKIKNQGSPEALLYVLLGFEKYGLIKKVVKATKEKNSAYYEVCSPFMAFVYYHQKDYKNFVEYLKIAVVKSPIYTKEIFSEIFPYNLDIKDYVAYASRNEQ